jgi:hypothetical protein
MIIKSRIAGSLYSPAWFAALGLVLCASTAQGGVWSCTHGQSGNIEYPDRLVAAARNRTGQGLDFTQKPDDGNWVQFAPPSVLGNTVRYIGLQFWTGSADAIVDYVHVYDLGEKVYSFDGLGWSNGWHTQVLDLGSDVSFNAIGISVGVSTGAAATSHRFIFTGACAFVTSPG